MSSQNFIARISNALIMYVDMNSFFASCEQTLNEAYVGKPIGVCPYVGPNAVIIAASREAKQLGVRSGMTNNEAVQACPSFQMVASRPVEYRRFHVKIMNILRGYCADIIPKSIDEAIVNLTHYTYIYKDVKALAVQIKRHLAKELGPLLTCSIGIDPNVFLAKLATELQKPDGLIQITPENVNAYLATLQLTDLPGIAHANEKRLNRSGIYTPQQMRAASESLLRKIFGGITGNYWYYRLHFQEVDLRTSSYRNMSAARSLSKTNRASAAALKSLLISLCTRLEQRLVKQDFFCSEISFFANYFDDGGWKDAIKLNTPVQDAMDILHYIEQRILQFEKHSGHIKVMRINMSMMGVTVSGFIPATHFQYSLFDNKMQQDKLRKILYNIKDKYGKNSVRKASETIEAGQMKDAIGFGSVKDLYDPATSNNEYAFNQFLLEDDAEMSHDEERSK